MKWIDLPPVWLCLFLGVSWSLRWPYGWEGWFWPGVAILVAAAIMAGLAVLAFHRARTTVVPHRYPSALVDSGIFRYTRNPIYLADTLILLGFSLMWGSAAGVAIVPILAVVLERRFIRPEEARLAESFGPEFTAYRRRTRRWF